MIILTYFKVGVKPSAIPNRAIYSLERCQRYLHSFLKNLTIKMQKKVIYKKFCHNPIPLTRICRKPRPPLGFQLLPTCFLKILLRERERGRIKFYFNRIFIWQQLSLDRTFFYHLRQNECCLIIFFFRKNLLRISILWEKQ